VETAAPRILELMFLTAWADARLEGSEALAIHKLAAQVPLLREVGPTADIEASAKQRLAQQGLDFAVREAAQAITNATHRQLAFSSCAKVSGADGTFDPREAQVLRILREVWQLAPEDVERMLVLSTRP
jgi:tellurite resistance protein